MSPKRFQNIFRLKDMFESNENTMFEMKSTQSASSMDQSWENITSLEPNGIKVNCEGKISLKDD